MRFIICLSEKIWMSIKNLFNMGIVPEGLPWMILLIGLFAADLFVRDSFLHTHVDNLQTMKILTLMRIVGMGSFNKE